MLPPEAVIRAAVRWLHILRGSTVLQGWSLIRFQATYTDLTQTQYASALEWLQEVGLVVLGPRGLELEASVKFTPAAQSNHVLFERTLKHASPAWLPDSDLLIPDETELPQDAAKLAEALGLSEGRALSSIRHLHGRVDLAQRARVGEAGECALIELLEKKWPGSTVHVAKTSDSFGYDILFRHAGIDWCLEIKSTTRRGRLVFYLSRHEHEVSLREPHWRLVVLGLDDELQLQAVATVRHLEVFRRSPSDVSPEAKWQSTSHEVSPDDLRVGLSFVNEPCEPGDMARVRKANGITQAHFAWLPRIETGPLPPL